MTELLVALALMAGVVGVSIALVQLMHYSEAKRSELLRRAINDAYRDGYHAGRTEK